MFTYLRSTWLPPYTVTIERDRTVNVTAGTFTNCVIFRFDVYESVDEERTFAFAPGVGIVWSSGIGGGYFELFAATVGGALITDVTQQADLPSSYTLDQNYPNPFTPSTTLRFSLPETADVSLKVFDLLGRNVATLIADRMTAGQHSVDFDATNLPSGTYVYRLEAGSFSQTKTMVLAK